MTRIGDSTPLQHDVLATVLVVYPIEPVHCDHAGRYDDDVESYVVHGFHFFGVRYLLRMYCATPTRMNMAVQNKKCVSIRLYLVRRW